MARKITEREFEWLVIVVGVDVHRDRHGTGGWVTVIPARSTGAPIPKTIPWPRDLESIEGGGYYILDGTRLIRASVQRNGEVIVDCD